MKVKEKQTKNLLNKEYFYMIKPYLGNIINDHKAHWKWKIHLRNKVIDYKTQGEWKIQLTITNNFISSKDFD